MIHVSPDFFVIILTAISVLAAALGCFAVVRLRNRHRFDTTQGWAVTVLIGADSLLVLLDPVAYSQWLDRITHVDNMVRLLQCLLALVAVSAAVLSLPDLSGARAQVLQGRLRRYFVWVGVASVVMVVTFVRSPVHESSLATYWADVVPRVSARTRSAAFWTISFWLAYASSMAYSLRLILPQLFRYRRALPDRRTGVAIWLLIGCASAATTYLSASTLVLVMRASGAGGSVLSGAEFVMRAALNLVMPALFAALICFAPLANKTLDLVRAYRDLRRLRPLWLDLAAATPVLEVAPRRRLSARLEEVRLRLYRMVIEIRDGYVAIAPWHGAVAAVDVADRLGLRVDDPRVDAVGWELARRSALRGDSRPSGAGVVPVGGASLEEEISLLRSAVRHRRVAHRYSDRLARSAPDGSELALTGAAADASP